MSRAELLERAHAELGHLVAPHRLEYLMGIGRVSRPRLVSGRHDYRADHLQQLLRAERAKAKAAK